jgi:pyruvate formate lyase activating enzyme
MERLRVSNIQHFSVNDGDGIRATVFLSGCPLRCPWCANPETWDPAPGRGAYPEGAKRLLGRVMSVDEILDEIRRHAIFQRSSGGGVTWSGGEPFFFPSGLRALVFACAELGIHQAIETSGFFSWPSCEDILGELDFVFLDIKHMDDGEHRRLTGMGNETILANAERLGATGIETAVRIPLVKGVNDGEENLARTATFVRRAMPHARIEILPYHDLGRPKYETLGLAARHGTYEIPSLEDVERAEAIVGGEGVEVIRYR